MASGGGILYAVDTNAIVLYIDPFGTSPRGKLGTSGYGEVFSFQEQTQSVAIGRALSLEIFSELCSPERPALLISPLNIELDRVLAALVSKATRAALPRSNINRPPSELERYVSNINNERIIRDELIKVIELTTHGASPINQLRRFAGLTTPGAERLVNVEQLADNQLPYFRNINTAFEAPKSLNEQDDLAKLEVKWFDAFRGLSINPRYYKSHRANRPREADVTDARVLARIEWINRRLVAFRK